MGNKVFAVVVFVLWASSMSWLMTSKILPSYLHGEAPSTGVGGASQPVAWEVELSGLRCGTAVTQAVSGVEDVTEVHSRIILSHVSLDKVAPGWMQALVQDLGDIRLDMRTKTTLDSFGNLATILSRVSLNETPSVVKVNGRVGDGKLKLRIQSGELVKPVEYPWRDGNLLGELTPESKLLQAYVGRTWRSEVYSPFGSPHDPVEVVEARVVEEERIFHSGELVRSRRIEYRAVGSAGVSSKNRLRSVVWVADDGRVLRQDVFFLSTRLRFHRLSDEQSQQVANKQLELGIYAAVSTPDFPTQGVSSDKSAP